MLRRLQIRDFVIVDHLELAFEHGFGALTGETGAGKSILVDALSLALGERADPGVIRHGRARADIGAEFEVAVDGEVATWLRSHDFDAEVGICLVRRVIDAGGRSRAYINGAPCTASQLRELGERLCDIHGQHAHHALLRAEKQRALIDSFGGLVEQAGRVADLYGAWQNARRTRQAAERSIAANAHERETLEWQVQELRALAFEPVNWQQTLTDHRRLTHAATLLQAAAEAMATLDDGDVAAARQVHRLASRLVGLAEYDQQLKEVCELLEGARIQLDEATHALRRYHERLDLDPGHLAQLEARIQAVDTLARKHRTRAEDLPALLARLEQRLDELESLADPQLLVEREKAAQQTYLDAAAKLSTGRASAATELSRRVSETMQELAMPGGRFDVVLERLAEGGAGGLESIEFQVSAHPAQPMAPMAKVASGGELSRIGLAIQVITSKSGQTPTLVFDEVDVGIGGAVAEIVGQLLKQLGRERQVLCVTHLPQVAAQGDWQWSVAKDGAGPEIVSRVHHLDSDGRIEEIARMLGGVRVTATTRKHAREMLGL
jgi:DNA repair protein RecN (Recombination protein N)